MGNHKPGKIITAKREIMGHLKTKIGKTPSKIGVNSKKKVIHRAKALTVEDVEANRSMAYSYLNL